MKDICFIIVATLFLFACIRVCRQVKVFLCAEGGAWVTFYIRFATPTAFVFAESPIDSTDSERILSSQGQFINYVTIGGVLI